MPDFRITFHHACGQAVSARWMPCGWVFFATRRSVERLAQCAQCGGVVDRASVFTPSEWEIKQMQVENLELALERTRAEEPNA